MSADVNKTVHAASLGLTSPDDLEELRSRDPHHVASITSMDLSHNLITNLRGFAKFTGLVELRLSGNRVKGLDGCLDGLVHLKRLDLSYNRLTSLEDAGSSLGNLLGLERLELQGNNISQLLGLQQCWRAPVTPSSSPANGSSSGLIYLDLRDNRIEDSTQLLYISGMGIKQLLLRGSREHRNAICDDQDYRLTALQTLPDLEVLDGRIVTEEERREARSKPLVILGTTKRREPANPASDNRGLERRLRAALSRDDLPINCIGPLRGMALMSTATAQQESRRSTTTPRNPWMDAAQAARNPSGGSREGRASLNLSSGTRSSLRRSHQVEAVETLSSQNDSSAANRLGADHRECERQMTQLRAMVTTMQEHYETMLREAAARFDGAREQLEATEEERRRLEASLKHGEKVKCKQEAALARDLRLLEADMEKRTTRLKTLEENLAKSEEKAEETQRMVDKLQKEKEELLAAKEDLTAKCSEMEERASELAASENRVRELELEIQTMKACEKGSMEAAVVTPGPSREDISAAVEAARREAAVVSGEKVSRLEEEKTALKKELQERKDQIRCQRQAYEALEQQLRLSTKQEQSRIAELTDELRSEKNASKSSHPVNHLGLLKLTVGRVVKSRDLCINYIPRRHAAEASGFHPADRRPGRSIGVDHCGPYKDNGGRTKYLAVATCLLTEFFDAEVVGSTNASNLILGYRRIFSGRGKAHRVCSDPGPAYVRAQYRSIIKGREVLERKLGRVEEELDREKVSVRELRSTMDDRERVAAVEAKERGREVEELRRELDKSKEDSHKHRKALRMVELEVTKDIERLVAEHGRERAKLQQGHEMEMKALGELHGKELSHLKEELAAKEKEVVELTTSVEHETTKARELKEATAALRKDLVVACKQLEKEVHQEQALQKKVQSLQAELEGLRLEAARERTERGRHADQHEALVAELKKKATEAERAREAAEAVRGANEESLRDVRRREDELQGKIRGLEELVRKHAIEATVKDRMVGDGAEHVKALKKQLQGLEADLEQMQKERKKRDREWQSLLDEEISKADRAREKLVPTEEKLAAAEGEVERLREEVSQKDESLRYVTSEVEEMRRAMQEDTHIKVAEVERKLNREHEKVGINGIPMASLCV
ncbi:hypothetical protein FOZ62_030266 [Perkinsus olseni]|uniref:Leucine-rich repeat and coiled-coil domain-containing protein 1 n=2 Tax=Perkinsus olseni TaxID=32597 RepID=A0A7J6SRC3_PEROL|nr:hypothetical protein FOZ62_030266 [Perkinsus olseni]